ncbi:hypothetical protein AB0M87_26125 [Streptomyces sp. NPDC051320]|uniref:hypothetical protein n=1 Tax=Streptomyces sp. NPDC051320 TaxID=3154644 RepID=UPI0034260003
MLACTVATQHPNPAFNRLQRKDTLSLLPNWRFFAPTPATHDDHLLYRTLDGNGQTSAWRDIDVIAGRKVSQVVWFATRRQEKAVFDVCAEILRSLDKGFDYVVNIPAYRVLVGYIRQRMVADGFGDAEGFQFTLVRAAGYDEAEEPAALFVSPYAPLKNHAETLHRHDMERAAP